MNTRGQIWLAALTGDSQQVAGFSASVMVVDGVLANEKARFIAVVKDENNPFPRARNGEVGLLEGWNIAKAVTELVTEEKDKTKKSTIVAVIDVPSQAYGRREEAYGIHQALAASINAYAKARMAGHPVIGLIVGKAMSGGFLAHGYQATRLISLDNEGCMVHAMGKESAARVTMRTVEQLEALASTIPPMAYDMQNFMKLGLISDLVSVENADLPTDNDVSRVINALEKAKKEIGTDSNDLSCRLGADARKATSIVKSFMYSNW